MSPFALSSAVSQQMRYARVLCIGLMIFVHADPVDYLLVQLDVGPILKTFYWLLVMELGRASVPLLSVISGLLIVITLQQDRPLHRLINDKAQRLLLPFLFWNAAFIALLASRDLLIGPTTEDLDAVIAEWPNRLLALTDTPANFPLGFLRDIFVCSILAGVAMWFERKRRYSGQIVMAGFLILAILLPPQYPLVLREMILAFYLVGMLIGCNLSRLPNLHWAFVLGLMGGQIALDQLAIMDDWAIAALKRIAVCLLLWKVAEALFRAEETYRWCRTIANQERYIYVVFCSHLIVTRVYGVAWSSVGLDPEAFYFPMIYLMNLPLAFLFAWVCWFVATRYIPSLQPFMLGTPFRKVTRNPDATVRP